MISFINLVHICQLRWCDNYWYRTVLIYAPARSFYDILPLVYMMTSSNGYIFRVTGPLCGEFTGHRWIPLTKASDTELWCFFEVCLNKRLSKQSRRRWFETPSCSLWRHCSDILARPLKRTCRHIDEIIVNGYVRSFDNYRAASDGNIVKMATYSFYFCYRH